MTTNVDAARVIASYQQALADATHRAVLAETLAAQQAAELEQLRAAGGAS